MDYHCILNNPSDTLALSARSVPSYLDKSLIKCSITSYVSFALTFLPIVSKIQRIRVYSFSPVGKL